jgi:hypothetical protein
MCDKLKCEVVRDLMPNYIEGLTSEVTNSLVSGHLEECEACKSLYDKLKADMTVPKFEKKDLLRLLRAIRKAKLTQIILAVLGGIILTWAVIFVMNAPFSVVSPNEIQEQDIYKLSDNSMVVAFKVPGLDQGMLTGITGKYWANGDTEFEVSTTFWNRLFASPDPANAILYYQADGGLIMNPDGTVDRKSDELFAVYYGYGKDRKELRHKGEPVREATEEFEGFIRSGKHQSYQEYLWERSTLELTTTPMPEPTPKI